MGDAADPAERNLGSRVAADVDPVEAAIARALELAAAASEWAVVSILARELEARRRGRVAPDVVDLAEEREKRPRVR